VLDRGTTLRIKGVVIPAGVELASFSELCCITAVDATVVILLAITVVGFDVASLTAETDARLLGFTCCVVFGSSAIV
jgi:hypothetical protein